MAEFTGVAERFRSGGSGMAGMTLPLTKSARTNQRRAALFEAQGGACAYCDAQLTSPTHGTLDHIKPRSKGGGNGIKNLALVCPRCNHLKGAIYTYAEAEACAAEMLAFFKRLQERGIIR